MTRHGTGTGTESVEYPHSTSEASPPTATPTTQFPVGAEAGKVGEKDWRSSVSHLEAMKHSDAAEDLRAAAELVETSEKRRMES